MPLAWQARQPASPEAPAESRVPVLQLGVARAPWQLTLEQVKAAGAKAAAPALAL